MKGESFRLLFIFIVIGCDGFLLHGSAGPLTARLGGAVLLPCFVDRPLPLEELEVDWRRTDSDTIVHLFQDGQTRPESQGDAYRGRAHFFPQEIPKGNFSLLLEGVRTADTGVYKCVVYTEQENHETRVEIQEVERLVVTGADEPVYAHAGEDVTLSCSVDTHVNVTELQVKWRKTDDDGDILVLLYADGENRPESQDGRYSGRAEFFTEEIPKGNFSMKLMKVRMEDKGEFRCEVHSDTDSANTTARIAALGYSSLHWLILWLCIAVTPVVLLTGALSVRYLRREDKSRQALLSHCSHVTVPPVIVSAAFILWGVNEGSTGEAVTCPAISLLNIPLLFIMAPYVDSREMGEIKYVALSFGSTIIITAVCVGSLIEFSAKYSPTPDEKATFGKIFGGIIFMFIFLLVLRILRFVLWIKDSSIKIRVYVARITGIIFLVIMASSIIAVSAFLIQYHSDAAWKEQFGTFVTMLVVPVLMVLLPLGFGIFWMIHSRSTTGKVDLRDILLIGVLFMYHPLFFNMLFLTIYSQLCAWMQNTFILDISIPIAVAALGLSACIYIQEFLCAYDVPLKGFYYFALKILLWICFMLHLILSLLFLSLIQENDKAKPHKYLYLSGVFALPLLNSVALAVALKFKTDTGKQPLDLRLIVLMSGSLFLFVWLVIQISAYCLAKKEKIMEELHLVERHQDPEPDQPKLLELLWHACECQDYKQANKEVWWCSLPQCRSMRKVLDHMAQCQAGTSCQVKHCTSYCQIISHWLSCTQPECPNCLPLKKEDYRQNCNFVTFLPPSVAAGLLNPPEESEVCDFEVCVIKVLSP
ncbi:uncharacterized protein LOC125704985 isoform X2 [Brienomyrus brachyistius]|uniref:uncharacterized protein LOC125704985 isoform X2 n=1 Tax=Brienomyrus brachyistius TaxID=42636 RepID=UPI0020B418F7|nr:uncharacterized protein LOC125704985 isoform X2 [Brienomyrus brachyistius]